MTLDVDVTAERRHYNTHRPLKGSLCIASLGGRRLAVRIAMEHPIGTLPRTPFASSRRSPQGETRDLRRKTASHILHVPFRRFPPFGGWRHHLSPTSGGTITRAYCRAIYEESVSRCFILPPPAGEVRRSRIGGGERSEPISRMLIKSYAPPR